MVERLARSDPHQHILLSWPRDHLRTRVPRENQRLNKAEGVYAAYLYLLIDRLRARRFREITQELEELLGYEPSNADVVGRLMEKW